MEGALATDDVSARTRLAASGAVELIEGPEGLLAVYPDADRAVAAAVALWEDGGQRRRAAVAEGPGDVTGGAADRPAATEARALLRLTRPGVTVLRSHLAERGAMVARPFERWFLTLDERDGPVPVVALVRRATANAEPTRRDRTPLPGPLRAVAAQPFVGRDQELAALWTDWKRALEGGRRVVVLQGEAGVGKSRLAAALAARVHADGGLVLGGDFDEGGAPYRPIADALRFWADRVPAGDLPTLLGPGASELSRLLPEREGELGPPRRAVGDGDVERHRLFSAVDAWLRAAAHPGGLLLVLDDAHVATSDAVALVAHLARSAESARLLIVALSRRGDEGAAWASLLASGALPSVDVAPFTEVDLAELAAVHVPAASGVAQRLGPQLMAATGGNALFVVQLAHHLQESGIDEAAADPIKALFRSERVPDDISDLVGRRLQQLGPFAVDVLSRGALIGQELDVELLRAVVDVDAEEAAVDAVLADAAGRGLLRSVGEGTFAFAHALVRVALADRLGPTRRARLHRRIADALLAHGRSDSQPGDVVRHLTAAGGADPRTFALARRAGELAMANVAYGEAEAMYRAAAATLPPDASVELHDEISLGIHTARHLAGKPNAAAEIIAIGVQAADRGDGPLAVRAALLASRGFFGRLAGIDEARAGLLLRALELHPEPDADRARLLARLVIESSFGDQVARQRPLATEALELARTLGADGDVLVDVLWAAQTTEHEPALLDERLRWTEEMVAVADATGDPVLRTRACWARADALLEGGRLAEFAVQVERGIELADAVGQPLLRWASELLRAGSLASQGLLTEAEAAAEAALALGMTAGQPDAVLFYGGVLFHLRVEQDRLDALADAFRPFAEDAGAPTVVVAMQAYIDAAAGDRDQAAARLASVLASGLGAVAADDLRLTVFALLAEVAIALGDVEAGRQIDGAMAPFDGGLVITVAGAVGVSGSVLHFRGRLHALLGDDAAAVDLLERALVRHEASGSVVWRNRSRLALAGVLLETDTTRARELVASAAAEAATHGLPAIAKEAARVAALSA